MSFFPHARNFQIHESEITDVRGDYNRTQNFNFNSGGQDIRKRIHSAMKNHIRTDAYHNSGVRRDPSRCYPGTREMTLKTISDWIEDPTEHYLWLHGPAGTGKSAIAYTVAEKCRLDGTLGASYVFTRGSTDRSPLFFSTLAYQLVLAVPDLRGPLWEILCEDPTVFDRSMSEQLDKLIVQPFLRLDNWPARVVIVIDGLDECDCTDGATIQGNIVKMILGLRIQSFPLLFLISSRPEPEIRRAFQSPPRSSLSLHRSLDANNSIRHFLREEFNRIYREIIEIGAPQTTSPPPWPSASDIEKLVDKSSGHFIYAATVIRFVQEDHAHPMDRLDEILEISSKFTSSSAAKGVIANSIAFQELDGLYLYIVRKYRNRAELSKILHAIRHFGNRASPGFIETVFDLRPRSVRIMLEGVHSIIGVQDNGPLWFLHASFTDFLADPHRSHEFHLETSRFNAKLAYAYMRCGGGLGAPKVRERQGAVDDPQRNSQHERNGRGNVPRDESLNLVT